MLKPCTVYSKLVQLLKQRQENTCLLDDRRYRSGSPIVLLGPAECLPLDHTSLVLVPYVTYVTKTTLILDKIAGGIVIPRTLFRVE